MATKLLSMSVPPAAADLTLRHLDLLLCISRLEQRAQTTTYSYWRFMGLSMAQARAALGKIETAGLAVSRVLQQGRSVLGKRWALTEDGRKAVEAYKATATTEGPAKNPPTPPPDADATRPCDLYEGMSEKGRAALRAALPDPVHGRVVDQLRLGMTPDPDQLVAWGVRDLVARDIATGAARIAAKLATSPVPASPAMDSGETRVPAASDEDLERARQAGVPIPQIAPGQGENAEAVAQAAQLLVREAAARRPELLRRGVLLARLPQMVWAMLHGAVADYGDTLKRARALLRWLADDKFQVPNGYNPSAGAAIRARLCIVES